MRPRHLVSALTFLGALACLDTSGPAVPCEGDAGDFPPNACAVLSARAVGVDTNDVLGVVGPHDSGSAAYASSLVHTDAQGNFTLVALQYGAPADTATVTLGVYGAADTVLVGTTPKAQATVTLTFARMGVRVDTTHAGDIVFH